MASPGPQSAAEAIPFRISPVLLPQPQCAIPPAAMAEDLEATRKKRRAEHREQAEVAAASSESPRPQATPDSKPESPAPVALETLTATAVAGGKGRTRNKQEVVAAAAASPLVEEAVGMEEKRKRKRSSQVEMAEKGAAARKEQRQGKVVQEQSGQLPFPIDAHPQGGEAPVNGGVSGIHCVKMDRFGKPRVLSKKQMVKVQIDFLKQHRKSRVFIPTIVNPSSIDHDPKYSSPCGALLFDQFSYKPDRRQGRSAPSLPKTPEPPARPLSRDHLSSRSSQVTANETFMDANTTILNTKQPRSASASGPQEEVEVEEKKRPEKNMSRMKKPGKPSPLLSAAENRSDKYHRIPLNQLVHPPCSLGINSLKKHQKPQVFIPTVVNPNSVDPDPKYSSPYGALLFDQFSYKPDRRQGCSAPSLPKTPEPPARPLSRDHLSSRSSQVTANETFMDANTTILSTKQPRSASASGPQEEVEVEEKKRPEKNMSRMKKPGKPSPLLSAAENRSDKYHRIPLNQLVLPPCSLGINSLKKHQKPQVFIPTVVNPNSVDPDPKYSSPYGALLFDQFSYKPDRRQGRSAPSLPKTPDPLARPLSRDHLSSRSSQLTANEAFMDANTTILNTKQPCSASASGPQEEVEVEEKKRPEKNMSRMKKPGKPSPLLSAAENRSDKYRRLPLNELVRPPRSPHKLLQEKYASDPWKVMVICMLLNQTQGKQVRKKVKGFFRRYPDAQTAFKADPEKMAEYLAPLGLQRVKTNRIQKFSKGYVQEEWKYVTELCGVGKYAADAYAIFCAGRATDVVPEDHKLVDYWKYVCFELPLIQASRNAQDFGVTTQGNFAPEVKQVALSC